MLHVPHSHGEVNRLFIDFCKFNRLLQNLNSARCISPNLPCYLCRILHRLSSDNISVFCWGHVEVFFLIICFCFFYVLTCFLLNNDVGVDHISFFLKKKCEKSKFLCTYTRGKCTYAWERTCRPKTYNRALLLPDKVDENYHSSDGNTTIFLRIIRPLSNSRW